MSGATTRLGSGSTSATSRGGAARSRAKATTRSPSASSTGGDIRMSALLLLALAVAITGLHNVLEDISWWFPAFGVMFVVFAVAAVVRFYLRRRWAGTVGAAVAALVILTLFFSADASLAGFVPTGDTIARFAALITAGNDSIARQTLPAFATPGIQFIICLTVAAIAVFMDAVANSWRAPALAGIPLLVVVVVPSIIIATLTDGLTFELTAIVYLFIVIGRRRRIQPAVAVAAGVVAVLGALVTPAVLPSVAPGGSTGSGLAALASSVNPIINLGNDLRDSDASPALSYTTTSSTGEYLQLTTLDTFQGKQWAPETPKLKVSHSVKDIGTPPGLGLLINETSVSTRIQVANASSDWLPLPYPASSVSGLKGTWLWEDSSLAVRSTNSSIQGQRYSVSSLDVEPTTQQLEAAPRSTSNPLAKVPAGLNPIIAATAKKVVGDAKTDFDKAVALQNWFRGGTFTYSTKAPKVNGYDGSGLDVIVPFLKAKSGYCVHFATTMAIMARTLGIPSRVAVGYLPGQLTHPGNGKVAVYQVSSSDLHAWPELYFKGVGWVRFEPTPSKGFEPNFPTAPGLSTTPGSTDPSTTAPTDSATTPPVKAPKLPNQGANQTSSTAVNDSSSVSPAAGFGSLGALAVLLLVAAPAVVRIGIRRRRLDHIRQGVDPAGWSWQELRETSRDLGIDARESLTPNELAAKLTAYLQRSPQRAADATAALAELRQLVEDEAYGVPAYRYNGEQMADALVTVLHGLRRSSGLGNRIAAVIVPPSLVDRVLGRNGAATA
jgi:transglutaminase-like putative cysteine protease